MTGAAAAAAPEGGPEGGSEPARILVSACLLGAPVRYDGRGKPLLSAHLDRWRAEGRVVAFCPEVAAGLPTPRPPAEIVGGAGADVIAGDARVLAADGADVSAAFIAGAEAALRLARAENCRFALLIDGSPSCGSDTLYDGTFSGRRVAGAGVTATVLRQAGIAVFAPVEIDALAAALAVG